MPLKCPPEGCTKSSPVNSAAPMAAPFGERAESRFGKGSGVGWGPRVADGGGLVGDDADGGAVRGEAAIGLVTGLTAGRAATGSGRACSRGSAEPVRARVKARARSRLSFCGYGAASLDLKEPSLPRPPTLLCEPRGWLHW